jgi:hypothetical protein
LPPKPRTPARPHARTPARPHARSHTFERYSAYFVHQVKVTDPDSCTRSTKRVPAWQLTCGDPIRSGYLPIAVLFASASASATVLRNRM